MNKKCIFFLVVVIKHCLFFLVMLICVTHVSL